MLTFAGTDPGRHAGVSLDREDSALARDRAPEAMEGGQGNAEPRRTQAERNPTAAAQQNFTSSQQSTVRDRGHAADQGADDVGQPQPVPLAAEVGHADSSLQHSSPASSRVQIPGSVFGTDSAQVAQGSKPMSDSAEQLAGHPKMSGFTRLQSAGLSSARSSFGGVLRAQLSR
jgi:hypothetical protein